MFTAYVVLEGIGGAIREDRLSEKFTQNSIEHYEQCLLAWYRTYSDGFRDHSDPLCLQILWHWTFMSIFVDLERLERAIGKDGPTVAAKEVTYCMQWFSSVNSRRCLLHAFLLQKQLESISLYQVLAIHVPRCLFAAAIVWFIYLESAQENLEIPPQENLDFPEMQIVGVDPSYHLVEGIGLQAGNAAVVKENTLCVLANTLRRTSHWGISQKFASIVGHLIHGKVFDIEVPQT